MKNVLFPIIFLAIASTGARAQVYVSPQPIGSTQPVAVVSSSPLSVSNPLTATISGPLTTDGNGSNALLTVRNPRFQRVSVIVPTNFAVAGETVTLPMVNCSNANVVAWWPRVSAEVATTIVFTVRLSTDGVTWHDNDDLVYSTANTLARTNHYLSVSADGAAFCVLQVSCATTNIYLDTNGGWYASIKQ